MAVYKEIVTKAVVGKGKKDYHDTCIITPNDVPTTVLGCWIINHNFKGYPTDGYVVIEGSYDVNVWYSYDNDTKTNVISKKITYSDSSSVKAKDSNDINSNTEVIVRSLKQPTVSKAEIEDKNIKLDIDKVLGIEIIGDTKAKILVEEDEDPWEVITDINDKIDKEVKEDYLNN